MKVRDLECKGENPYSYIRSLLAHRNEKRIAHNTSAIVNDDSSVSVWFHKTEIVRAYSSGRTIYRNGNYETTTTKARLNAFIPRNGAYIASRKFVWYVFDRSHSALDTFTNGMAITFDQYGNLVSVDSQPLSAVAVQRCHNLAFIYCTETTGDGSNQSVAEWCDSDNAIWHALMMTTVPTIDLATATVAGMARAMRESGIGTDNEESALGVILSSPTMLASAIAEGRKLDD